MKTSGYRSQFDHSTMDADASNSILPSGDKAALCAWVCGGEISEFCIPLIGNFMFLPLITVMVEVLCVRGALASMSLKWGSLIVTCQWTVVGEVLTLQCQLSLPYCYPIIIIQRPAWQERQVTLNIKSSIPYLALKSIVQVLIVYWIKPCSRITRSSIQLPFSAFSSHFQYSR